MTRPEDTPQTDYFEYLTQRSELAKIYRTKWLYPRLCRHLSGQVLDVGCGIGDFLDYRAGTIGTDINARAVDWCRRKGHEVVQMTENRLPFDAASFDGLVLDNVLEHIAEPRPLLSEAKRVLKSGGHAIIGVPGRKGYASDPDHKVFYDADWLRKAVEYEAFEQKHLLHMPFKLGWLDRNARQYCLYGVFTRR